MTKHFGSRIIIYGIKDKRGSCFPSKGLKLSHVSSLFIILHLERFIDSCWISAQRNKERHSGVQLVKYSTSY